MDTALASEPPASRSSAPGPAGAIGDEYVAQPKPAGQATFEYAKQTGRKPYFHFEGPPEQTVINKINEYARRYGVEPVIDISPLG